MTKTASVPARYALPAFHILIALVFLAAATVKLLGLPQMVVEFDAVGLGQGFRYVVAGIEILGAGMLLGALTRFYGAATLFMVCLGALLAQFLRIHQDVIHVFVLLAATAFLAWTDRPRSTA